MQQCFFRFSFGGVFRAQVTETLVGASTVVGTLNGGSAPNAGPDTDGVEPLRPTLVDSMNSIDEKSASRTVLVLDAAGERINPISLPFMRILLPIRRFGREHSCPPT